MYRIGQGYDVHKLVEKRKLILGGVEIPHKKGLAGHSDADVLTHAVMDALLGAAGMGDIGRHFPDSDPAFKGADSIDLLQHVRALIAREGYDVINIDATLILQEPKVAPYIDAMRERIASAVRTAISRVSIKATTEEGLGFTGRKEGVAAMAVAMLSRTV
ncbi:MAG: 2-C-methyl-D-erythritol 2,4-cyclodiphosphate synthase [Candidatus Marinimicrobia bacterium]|nr:2-C-methyl-D-erythritol 2,4-cyclodiphosphate synthase [Candidatus Neomarinimicrobiota bacterium]